MSTTTRVTVTLDPQVAEWAKQTARRHNRSLSSVVNAAVRTALVGDSLAKLVIDDDGELEKAHDDQEHTDAAAAHTRHTGGAA